MTSRRSYSSIYVDGGPELRGDPELKDKNQTVGRTRSGSIVMSNSGPGRVSKFFAILFSMVALLTGVFTVGSAAFDESSKTQTASAEPMGFLCDGLGLGMQNKDSWKDFWSSYPAMDVSGRNWTMQEAFARNAQLVNYYGEGGKDKWFVVDSGEDRGKGIGNIDQQKDKLNGLRGVSTCFLGNTIVGSTNFIFGLTNIITSLTSSVATMAFDPGFICKSANDNENSGACVNLLKIVGGTGNDTGGLIGILTNGVYVPLIVMLTVIIGFWIFKTAFKDKQIRKALFGLAWTFAAVILGLGFLMKPALIAGVPMKINNTLVGCVVGSMNGQNCMTGASFKTDNGAVTPNQICNSATPGTPVDQQLSMTVNGLSCQIWKAFVLEPYSQASFGRSYEDMELDNKDIAKAVQDAKLNKEDFKVSLSSDGSGNSMEGGTLVLNGGRPVYNLVAYQMFLKTNASMPDQKDTRLDTGQDKNWYKVISVTATNNDLWNSWTWNLGSGFSKMGTASIALLTAIIGSFLIVFIGITAMMFYILSAIVMALAPLFFLVAVHPGSGRRFFLGWLEQLVGNLFKYIVSSLFLILSVIVYGGILGNSSSLSMTVIMVLVVSLALFMFRGEILGLVGNVSMGGKKIGSNLASFADRAKSSTRGLARQTVGGAIGGAAVTGGFNPLRYAKSGFQGGVDGFKRDLGRGEGIIGGAMRAANRISADNIKDMRAESSRAKTKSSEFAREAERHEDRWNEAAAPVKQIKEQYDNESQDMAKVQGEVNQLHQIEELVRIEMAGTAADMGLDSQIGSDFAAIKNMDSKIAEARALGNNDRASELEADQRNMEADFSAKYQPSQDTFNKLSDSYNKAMATGLKVSALDHAPDFEALKSHAETVDSLSKDYNAKIAELNDIGEEAIKARIIASEYRGQADELHDYIKDWKPGDTVTSRKFNKTMNRVKGIARKAGTKEAEIANDKFTLDELPGADRSLSYDGPDKVQFDRSGDGGITAEGEGGESEAETAVITPPVPEFRGFRQMRKAAKRAKQDYKEQKKEWKAEDKELSRARKAQRDERIVDSVADMMGGTGSGNWDATAGDGDRVSSSGSGLSDTAPEPVSKLVADTTADSGSTSENTARSKSEPASNPASKPVSNPVPKTSRNNGASDKVTEGRTGGSSTRPRSNSGSSDGFNLRNMFESGSKGIPTDTSRESNRIVPETSNRNGSSGKGSNGGRSSKSRKIQDQADGWDSM